MANKIIITFLFVIIFDFFPFILEAQTFQWVKNQTHNIPFNPGFASFSSEADKQGNSFLASINNYKLSWAQNFLGDVSLKKFNSSGALLFNKIFYGKILISFVETDSGGNVYIAGSFMDTLKIDSANLILNTGSGFDVNYFMIKLNANGNFIWKKNINAVYTVNYILQSIKIKGNNLFAGLMNFPQGYIKKYDLNGNELITITQTTGSISSIDIDLQGNIFAGGATGNGNIDFNGQTFTAPFTYNFYIVKYNASGTCLWAKFVEDVTFQKINIACDNSGNLFAAGDLSGSFMFGTIQSQGPQWVYDFFLTKLDPSGNFLWVREVPNTTESVTGDAGKANLKSLIVDLQNNIYFCGFLRGTVNWGNNITTICPGSSDILLLKYDTNGNILLGKRAGGMGGNRADDISLDNSGNVFLSGNFSSTAFFDSIAVSGTGNINSFITKIPQNQMTINVNLTLIMEGFYNSFSNNMELSDTARVFLRNLSPPYAVVDSAKSIIDAISFTGLFNMLHTAPGNYFIEVRHRNTIETWSSSAVNFTTGVQTNYNFTNASAQAYGNNMKQVDTSPVYFAIYSGDVNQDGTVDLSDLGFIDNDASNFVTGYVRTDVNGDGVVDIADAAITDNNVFNFVSKVTP